MIAKLFSIKETSNKGQGLFAKEFIPKGTIICFECNKCQALSEEEFNQMSEKEKEIFLEHAYRKKDGSYLMPCDETKLLNHSCDSNILDTGKGFDIVVKDIKQGEEATYDYRVFYDDLKMPCNCGENNCCKVITCEHPVPKELEQFWLEQINSALDLIDEVEQPLKEEIEQTLR
ncbi:MAG: SET domain-containing protein [Patescibacteria group bacterium]|jgi:SET domain-containing protein